MCDLRESVILYKTRDSNNQEIQKNVVIKRFKPYEKNFICPIWKKGSLLGFKCSESTSANFTDWAYVGEFVCEKCADLFSLYFYNYIVDPTGIRLLNVRQLRDELIIPQKAPFLFIITTSKKKHLFYRAKWNYGGEHFFVNLETEPILTTTTRMRTLFDFVECLQTLGCSKEKLKNGDISFSAAQKINSSAFRYLEKELIGSREIQIPLYCGQKREILTEDAICCINSILKA